jgi:peptidoglycan/xylan/chitin deacetylase (PgdA/CDA1 family)
MFYAGGIVQATLKARTGSPMILMYHGVTTGGSVGLSNCEGKHVPRDLFIEQLRFIKKYRNVISVTEMVEGIRRGDELHNTVALTFDDGYENNCTVAAEILSDFNMPATLFISTGYIGVNRWMWTDRVEHALDRTDRDAVTVPGIPGVLSLATFSQKKLSLRRIKAYLKQQPGENCESCVRELENELGLGETDPDGDYRFMSWHQVRKIAAASFEIGAHTVNHPILSRISHKDAINEILACRERIRAELDRCSEVFCYPNGKSTDYTDDIKDVCRLHFRAALSTNRGPARLADLYELNRIGIDSSTTLSQLAWDLFREK